jgi:hypothetical protein
LKRVELHLKHGFCILFSYPEPWFYEIITGIVFGDKSPELKWSEKLEEDNSWLYAVIPDYI